MPETKSFNNPTETLVAATDYSGWWFESDMDTWPADKWDLTVTFTRKRGEPFKPGDRVDTYDDGEPDNSPGTVVRVNRMMRTVDVSWDVSPTVVQEWDEDRLEHTTL